MKQSILQLLRACFSPASETVIPERSTRVRLSGKAINIPVAGDPEFSIEMGKQLLYLCPDTGIAEPARSGACDYILFDPERYLSGIAHFLRLSPGQTLTIDSKADYQQYIFSHPREAFRRHVSIMHAGDALVFRDPISELGTWITLLDRDHESGIAERRRVALLRVAEIYGGPLQPLPADSAMERLVQVNNLLGRETTQQRDSMENPGGMVELPGHLTPVIVGDLHAQIDNLLGILSANAVLDSLDQGSAALIFLGDAVHQEPPGPLQEMDSSLLMMDLVFSLKLRYPGQVFYIIGNHDSFQHELMKRGVPQGLLWDKHIVAVRGTEYRDQLELFYRQSPLLVLSPDFIACHAGPARRKITRQTLTDVHQFPSIAHDLTWGRIKTTGYPGGYTRSNVKQFRKGLAVDPETPFIVGHHPFTEDDTLWMNVGQIKQHHIVISSRRDRIGLFTRVDGAMIPQIYPREPLLDWLNGQLMARPG